MNLTSEQVHWIYGALISVVSMGLIVAEASQVPQKHSRPFLIGTILFLAFGFLIDPLLHGNLLPRNYFQEMRQHNALGLLLLGLGTIEFLRFKHVLHHTIWGAFLPLALLVAGLIFFFHAQHDSQVPMLLLMTQHRIYGVTLFIAGVTQFVAYRSKKNTHPSPFAVAWVVCLLILGLELLLYTEGDLLIPHG